MFSAATHNQQQKKTNLKVIPRVKDLQYTERFSRETLNAFRLMGDPKADRVCEALHYKHGGLVNIHDLLSTVQEKAKIEGGDGDVFREFLLDAETRPEWCTRAVEKEIYRGQEVQAMLTPFMGLSLFSGSLVGGSQFITSAVVTALAGNITTDPTRRVRETGLLIVSLAIPGSLLNPGAVAHDSLTRVRLLHAALRTWLPTTDRLKNHKNLVPERVYVEGEVPICQQDLAITLGIFCYLNLRSLRRMSVILSKRDIQAYVTMWRYAGKVLGIHEDLLPVVLEDQEEFMLASMLHQGAPECVQEDGIKAFINAFSENYSRKTMGLLGPNVFDTFLQQMTRYLNGSEYVSGMNIEDKGDYHWSILLTRGLGFTFGTAFRKVPLGERVLIWLYSNHIKKLLEQNGTAVGHGAGSGKDISGTANVQSKL